MPSRAANALLVALAPLVFVALILPSQASAIGLVLPNDQGVRPFDVERHKVDITITNNAAVTRVEQVFKNHTNRPMEATFVFPLPRGATVSDFSLWIGGKKTQGAVLDRAEARRVYEQIVRRVRDPGLVEYIDGRLFRASIFPIPPGGTQKLELKFAQVLTRRGGLYRYSYPMAAGAEYVTATTEKDFVLTANVQAPMPITAAYSPTHRVDVHREHDRKVVLGVEELRANLDRDFELYLGYATSDIGLNMMTWDPDGEGGEDGYFMMALAPRVEAKAHDEIGQTYTFVMDTSGSMVGDKIEQARQTLAFCLERLDPQDHFNVIRFSTGVEPLFAEPQLAGEEAVARGVAFARNLRAAGGTAIASALDQALAQRTPADKPHQIIFVTDGIPTVGESDVDQIRGLARGKLSGEERLFTFGVGFDVNTRLLDGLAEDGRARSDYVKPEESIEDAVAALYTRISSPVLTDLSIDFGGAGVYDVFPSPLPDLFRGDQVVAFGRYRGQFRKPIVVRGKAGPETKRFSFGGKSGVGAAEASTAEVDTEPLEFIPKLWATRKVGFLLDQIRLNGEQAELTDEVVRLAKKFGLVTPYTSYLAVDDSEFEEGPRSEPRPRAERRTRSDFEGETLSGKLTRPDRRALRSSGRAGGATAAPPPRARRKRARVRSKSAAPMDESFAGFDADTGDAAVAASEATRDLKEKDTVAGDSRSSRRWVAGKTFERVDGWWIEEGLTRDQDAQEVARYSEAFFTLLREQPAFKQIAGLGDRVVFKVGGRAYRLVPEEK